MIRSRGDTSPSSSVSSVVLPAPGGPDTRIVKPHRTIAARRGTSVSGNMPNAANPCEADAAHHEATDRDSRVGGDAVFCRTAEHHHDPGAIGGLERQHRRRGVEASLAGAGHPSGKALLVGGQLGGRRPQRPDVDLAPIDECDPGRLVRVDVDLFDGGIVDVRLERAGAGEIGHDAGSHRAVADRIERSFAAGEPDLVDRRQLLAEPRADEQLLPTCVCRQ